MKTRRCSSLLCLSLALAGLLAQACDGEPPPLSNDELGTSAQALVLPPLGGGIPIGPPGPVLPPPGTRFNRLLGTLMCAAPNGGTTENLALAGLPIEVAGQRVVTGDGGHFELRPISTTRETFRFVYDGTITSDGVSSSLRVVDELGNARNESRSLAIPQPPPNTLAPSLALGTIVLSSLDCELYRIGRLGLRDFHRAKGTSPPGGGFRIKRWSPSEIHLGPHTFYDNVSIQHNWLDVAPTITDREATLFHEFGHAIRHVADGPEHHWNWDNFRWAYGRDHSGTEIFNTQYAFNEGWANYWEFRATGYSFGSPFGASGLSPPHPAGFLHWNEVLIGNRLLALSRLPGSSDRVMVEVLESLPGSIHSLHEFESHLNARLRLPAPPAPPACPPGFTDDGATCRQGGAVVAKPSYGRGVGTIPNACGAGNQYDAGLCYPLCAPGFHGVGPVCWQNCPPGFTDIGLFCARDFDWRSKSSYGRGAGWVPNACEGGKQYQNGLCYDTCSPGWTGEGPVCWGHCPATYTIDDGALCRQPLNILVKF